MTDSDNQGPAQPCVLPTEPAPTTPPSPPSPFPDDKFRHGRVLRFFPQAGYGFIKDGKGEDVYFHIDEVRMLGPKKDRSFVMEGSPVGFDVGVTSRGMRVTHMKLY